MSSHAESNPFLKDEALDATPRQHGLRRRGTQARPWWPFQKVLGDAPRMYCIAILVCLTTSLVWGSVLLYVVRHSPRLYYLSGPEAEHNQLLGLPISGYKFLMCGSSVQEAKSLGCEYDILANYWAPSLCMDREAIADY